MPLETWFPTVIYYEDLDVAADVRAGALAAIRERVDPEIVRTDHGMTAGNSRNDLHLDARVGPLLELFREPFRRFLFDAMLLDPARVEFYMGRCWPVVVAENGYPGGVHVHSGAVFSGVFYLLTPPGSGGLQFLKPVVSPHDGLARSAHSELTYQVARYEAREHRLILFSADLRHQRLPNAGPSEGERLAIAFDLYSMTDIEVPGGGLPRANQLLRVAWP